MFTWKGLGGGQPDYPAALSSLQHMDSEQLKVGRGQFWIWLNENLPFQDILNNEDKFDQFIRELPQMKALQDEKEMLLTSNKSLAEYNLSQVWFSNLCGSTMKSSQLQMKLLSYDRFEPGGPLNNRVSKVRLEQLESIHPSSFNLTWLQEPVVREAKARLREKYRTAQQLGEEVNNTKIQQSGWIKMRYTETAGSWAESSFGHEAGQRQPWHFTGPLGGGQPGGGSHDQPYLAFQKFILILNTWAGWGGERADDWYFSLWRGQPRRVLGAIPWKEEACTPKACQGGPLKSNYLLVWEVPTNKAICAQLRCYIITNTNFDQPWQFLKFRLIVSGWQVEGADPRSKPEAGSAGDSL